MIILNTALIIAAHVNDIHDSDSKSEVTDGQAVCEHDCAPSDTSDSLSLLQTGAQVEASLEESNTKDHGFREDHDSTRYEDDRALLSTRHLGSENATKKDKKKKDKKPKKSDAATVYNVLLRSVGITTTGVYLL